MILCYNNNTLVRFFRLFILAVVFLIAQCSLLHAQDSTEVRTYIEKLDRGQTDEVRKALPGLITKYQNDPGVFYLQARLTSNGIEALKLYQTIVTNFPKSEWADDALFHEYQYYYTLELYKTAEAKLLQLKKEYPHSRYASTEMGGHASPMTDRVSRSNNRELPKGSERSAPKTDKRTEKKSTVPNQPKKEPVSQGRYALQVGAFTTSANAEKQKSFFESRGYSAEVTNKVRNGKSYFVVWVGSYRTPDEAKKTSKVFNSKYKVSSIIVER